MFKCCMCNKSSKKEKPSDEVTKSTPKHSQRAADSQVLSLEATKSEENGTIGRDEKLNGDVQRVEKVPSPMENHSAEIVDDLTTKSPVPFGKRDEIDDESTRRKERSGLETHDKKGDVGDEDKNVNKPQEGKSEEARGGEIEDTSGNIEVGGSGNMSGGGDEGGGGKLTEGMLSSGVTGVVKTNLYDASAYIERTIDDGPDEEGDDSVFEACSNDNDTNKKAPQVSSISRWLSEEEDGEHDSEGCSGMQEPPATPVARDELALRRHRFFSDLLHATQNATEHRVRFDPLGPMVHAG